MTDQVIEPTAQTPILTPPIGVKPGFSTAVVGSVQAAQPKDNLPLVPPVAGTVTPPQIPQPMTLPIASVGSGLLTAMPAMMPPPPAAGTLPPVSPPDMTTPSVATPILSTNPVIRQNQLPGTHLPEMSEPPTAVAPQLPPASVPATIPVKNAQWADPAVQPPPPEQLVTPSPESPTQTGQSTASGDGTLSKPTDGTPIITQSSESLGGNVSHYKGPRPVVLLMLDGWGIGPNNAGNAIARAKTPNLTKYWMSYPHTQLEASGTAVGLPQGEDGNTETGHLNIGAGHIVYQDLPRINMAIADGLFFQNDTFIKAVEHVKANNSTLHLMGLIGAGGVHSNIEHLYALLNFCSQQQVTNVIIHGFTDGRDSPPTSGIGYVHEIMSRCEQLGVGKLGSLMGRYFAMDRDRRWERVEKAYDALVDGNGNSCILNPLDILQSQYDQGITDEFIEPITICDEDGSKRVVKDNDAVIFFNYRIDRPRELTRAFVLPDFESGMTHVAFDPYTEKYEKTNIQKEIKVATFQRKKVLQNLFFVTMTMYEDNLPVHIAFPPQNIKEPLGKVFADHGLRQLRTTETEKERFVTYYMNGQIETLYPGEERVIIPSKGVKSYDQAPEMSSREITAELLKRLDSNLYDVVIANICNGDMVGHTGNLEAAIKACEIVDEVVGQIVEKVLLLGGMVFITADHGNVEEMINNSTGEVDTEHSVYPVPLYIIGKQYAGKSLMLPSGILADVAPTILSCMGIPKPSAMTGRALL